MSEISPYIQWSSSNPAVLRERHGSMRTKALLGRVYSFMAGHSRSLLDLNTEVSERKIRGQHDAGSRTVPINRIKGSEGRSGDFDCDFNPMHTRSLDRWVSVAVARSSEATLPAVELIQLGEDYYVRDGHHRISVARAFGEEYIDAKVVVLELEPVSAPLPTLVLSTSNRRLKPCRSTIWRWTFPAGGNCRL